MIVGKKTFVKKAEGPNGGAGDAGLEGAYFLLLDGDEAMKWSAELIVANTTEGINKQKFGFVNEEGKYAVATGDDIDVGDPIILRSGSGGDFEITGLAYSRKYDDESTVSHHYRLEEVQAPAGYAKLDANTKIPFEVKNNDEEVQILNKPNPFLPNTGGIGSLIFVVLGLSIMAASYILYKRRNKETN